MLCQITQAAAAETSKEFPLAGVQQSFAENVQERAGGNSLFSSDNVMTAEAVTPFPPARGKTRIYEFRWFWGGSNYTTKSLEGDGFGPSSPLGKTHTHVAKKVWVWHPHVFRSKLEYFTCR